MPTNLTEYDLRELRRIADPNRRSPANVDESEVDDLPESAGDALRRGEREELVRLQTRLSAAGDLPEKPYLESLPTEYGAEVIVFEWLDFLINKAGFENTGNALEYYVDIDWITEATRQDLRGYMHGFSEVESFDPDHPGPADLDLDDHVLSLVYIARLASIE